MDILASAGELYVILWWLALTIVLPGVAIGFVLKWLFQPIHDNIGDHSEKPNPL